MRRRTLYIAKIHFLSELRNAPCTMIVQQDLSEKRPNYHSNGDLSLLKTFFVQGNISVL